MAKTKIPPRRIPSDDCVVYVGREISVDKDPHITKQGTPYKVHEGEWVDILPVTSVSEAIAISNMMGLGVRQSPQIAERLEELCEGLSKRVVDWNWTGMDGKRLPKPHNRPDVIKSLTEDEIIWLTGTAQGESPGERKNDSEPLGDSQ